MIIISGHQPAYLPWLGLFHKISLCDKFVYMDTVQYLDGDWNNRNKIKTPNNSFMLSIPINKKSMKKQNLNEIKISDNLTNSKEYWQRKHWETIKINYKKAPYFEKYAQDFEEMYCANKWENLVDICWYQFNYFLKCLGLDDIEIYRMSETKFEGIKDDLVLDHCKKLNGSAVVFGSQGRNYVDVNKFNNEKNIFTSKNIIIPHIVKDLMDLLVI